MAAARRCTECPRPVDGRAKTCSATCRKARQRRIAKARAGFGTVSTPDRLAAEMNVADPEALIEEAFKQELTPVIREAITGEVVAGLHALAALTPRLVASLAADLEAGDAVARGRAQAIVAKYTLGTVDPNEGHEGRDLHVHLPGMPTPAAPVPLVEAAVSVAEQQCERCGTVSYDFEPGALRCGVCQAALKSDAIERFA